MLSLLALVSTYQLSLLPASLPAHAAAASRGSQTERMEQRAAARKDRRAMSGGSSSDDFYLGKLTRPAARSDNVRGVYLSATSVKRADFLEQTFDRLEAAGANAFVFDVKGSNVYFQSSAPLAVELDLVRPQYDIAEVIRRAHERGFYTIGRFISLKDALFAKRRPDAQIKHPKTGRSVGDLWVDASAAVTLEYNRQVLRDLLASGVDEVNLDYIRYPTEYAQASIGLSGKEKGDRIEEFIRMVRHTIDQVNPSTKFGVSTYAIMGWNYPVNLEAIGQDFVRYAPMLDVISPMAYPSTFAEGAYYTPGVHPRSRSYYLVWKTLDGYKKLLGPAHEHKLRPWIQGYYISTKDARDQIDAVYDAGLCGFQFWNANNNYEPAYAGMKAVPVPERCL